MGMEAFNVKIIVSLGECWQCFPPQPQVKNRLAHGTYPKKAKIIAESFWG